MIASSSSPGSTIAAASRTASETVGVRWWSLSGIDRQTTPVDGPKTPYLDGFSAHQPLAEHDLGVVARRLGDRAAEVALRGGIGGADHPPGDQLLQHDRHLLLGEGGAEATT